MQASAAADHGRVHRQHTRLRADDHDAVLGDEPAAGAQPVSVEAGPDGPPVGERHGRGPVPGLEHRGAVAIEAVELRRHVVAPGVRGGDHHHHRVGQRAAGEQQQLEHAIEGRGVRAALRDQRQAALEVLTEKLGAKRRLTGAHPMDIAVDRVDLAVVGEQAQRLGEFPAREGVRRKTRVDHCERALQLGVAQVLVKAPELRRGEHALVDEGARAKARDRQVGAGIELGDPARDEQAAFELVLVDHARACGDEQLAKLRGDVAGRVPAVGEVDRHLAPAERQLAGRDYGVLDDLLLLSPKTRIA